MTMTVSTKTILAAAVSIMSLSGAASAAEPASCGTVRFSDVGWTDITATTALTATVLKALGYRPEITVLSLPVTFSA